jgi:hypothetical protein
MIKRFAGTALLGAAMLAAPAGAAVNLVAEGGGTPVVFEGDNGNLFAVLGIDARRQDSDTVVNLPDFLVDDAYIRSLIPGGGGSLANAYFCPDLSGGVGCSPLTSVSVSDEARLFDSLLLEFSAGTSSVTFRRPSGGTTSLGLAVTRTGPPPLAVSSAVPEPATWAMMLLGFFAIGGMMRVRKPKVSYSFA